MSDQLLKLENPIFWGLSSRQTDDGRHWAIAVHKYSDTRSHTCSHNTHSCVGGTQPPVRMCENINKQPKIKTREEEAEGLGRKRRENGQQHVARKVLGLAHLAGNMWPSSKCCSAFRSCQRTRPAIKQLHLRTGKGEEGERAGRYIFFDYKLALKIYKLMLDICFVLFCLIFRI